MKLYLDLFSGISGDMLCGALLKLGVPFEYLKCELEKLNLDGYKIEYKTSEINGIGCGDFNVVTDNTDHTHHNHNSLKEIIEMIDNSSLSESVKERAVKVFNTLAEAEAKVHNIDPNKLHFHEVGAVDSIVDIVGVSVCLDYLKIDKFFFGDLPSFRGEIKCSHGIIPLPGPAVCELTLGMKWNDLNFEGELITPTGAAFLKAFGKQRKVGDMTLNKVGYGCGKRKIQRGNYLRAFLIDNIEKENSVFDIEFNVDDMSPELHEPLMKVLYEKGALDVMIFSGMMKKGRLGVLVKVLCNEKDLDAIGEAIFLNSTTIGLRYCKKDRVCLERRWVTYPSEFGDIEYKETLYKGKVINSKPEFECLKTLSEKHSVSVKEILSKL
ncbi:MAG: nickel pincer cofactor biosynthesis protein LarC [Abditibacteriota bacterium]|nr:nickel pincer cofactor biosynthesis protein LarC [Abditibacteriota bacterium]